MRLLCQPVKERHGFTIDIVRIYMFYGFDTCCSMERMNLIKLSTALAVLQRRALYRAELVGMAVDNELYKKCTNTGCFRGV